MRKGGRKPQVKKERDDGAEEWRVGGSEKLTMMEKRWRDVKAI